MAFDLLLNIFNCACRHFDNKFTESSLPGEDTADNLFSLNISLVYMTETNRLAIKISPKVLSQTGSL